MVDEAAHVGQRRNFIGRFGIRLARWLVSPLYRIFFHDIPEAKYLFNIDQMVQDGLAFDYKSIPAELMARSWVPTYCKA
jgi:hypothetical protein